MSSLAALVLPADAVAAAGAVADIAEVFPDPHTAQARRRNAILSTLPELYSAASVYTPFRFFGSLHPPPPPLQILVLLLKPLLTVATMLFIARIIMSWDPAIKPDAMPWSIAYLPTEPLLGPTRKVIQPVGGVDVAPVVWLAFISLLNELLLGPQGILVLISNSESLL